MRPALAVVALPLAALIAPACSGTSGGGQPIATGLDAGADAARDAAPAPPRADGGPSDAASPGDAAAPCAPVASRASFDTSYAGGSFDDPGSTPLWTFVDPRGRLVAIAAEQGYDMPTAIEVVRFAPGGGLDASFGKNGILWFQSTGMLFWGGGVDVDGAVLLAGTFVAGADQYCAIVRLTDAGALDTSLAAPTTGGAPGAPAGVFTFGGSACHVSSAIGQKDRFVVAGNNAGAFAGTVGRDGTSALTSVPFGCPLQRADDGTAVGACAATVIDAPPGQKLSVTDASSAGLRVDAASTRSVVGGHAQATIADGAVYDAPAVADLGAGFPGGVVFPFGQGVSGSISEIVPVCDGTLRVASFLDSTTLATRLAFADLRADGTVQGTPVAVPIPLGKLPVALAHAADGSSYVITTDHTSFTAARIVWQ